MNRGLATTGADPSGPPAALREMAEETLALSRDHLLSRQHADGHWRAVLQTNVTMDAEDILLRVFFGHHRGGATPGLGGLDPLPAGSRWELGQLPRRRRRPLDDH